MKKKILDSIISVQFSLLKKETDTDKYNKAEYSKKKTVKFVLPPKFPQKEYAFKTLCEDMYTDLMNNAPDDTDYIGLWIEYDIKGSIIIDNAISLQTLSDIQEYSKDPNISVAYEFFKMTLPE